MPKLPTKVIPLQLTPYWQSKCGRYTIYNGDCHEVMAQMPADSMHAVVSDPPYGLGKEPVVAEVMDSWIKCGYHEVGGSGFMGKEWDSFVPQPATWRECVRVMKPGAHMLCFAGSRTLDWMGMSLRFVGLECRDHIFYMYGSGFPKGHDISKAIDRMYGAEREKVRHKPRPETSGTMAGSTDTRPWIEESRLAGYHEVDGNEPVTEDAQRWSGWNVALKPAYEPIIMSRKPLIGTIAANVLEHGTGGINVDGCRVGTDPMPASDGTKISENRAMAAANTGRIDCGTKVGRWPANIILDGSDEVVAVFPESKSGESGYNFEQSNNDNPTHVINNNIKSGVHFGDSGSAARFFYTTKADKVDRGDHNGHPTVKPTDLMQYLCRLVTPPDGVVLDPFMGSGSTGVACVNEGFRFIGIEQSEEYCDTAVGRLQRALIDAGLAQPNVPKAKAMTFGRKM